MLLTLVENAIEHGVEPQLSGGRLVVTGRLRGAAVQFSVSDSGAGLPAGVVDGVGLSNVRERLALACGDAARLQLSKAPEGGCRAEIELPFRTEA